MQNTRAARKNEKKGNFFCWHAVFECIVIFYFSLVISGCSQFGIVEINLLKIASNKSVAMDYNGLTYTVPLPKIMVRSTIV